METGYIQVYTGNGKGKTTAAFGLAVRAACAGKRVFIGQFVKDMAYSETKISNLMPLIHIEQLGKGCFIENSPNAEDKKAGKLGLERCAEILKAGAYDVVILDEIFIAIYFDLITEIQVLQVLKEKEPSVEVILTGRYAPKSIMQFADLVTEMTEIKHYYQKGVLSRQGIDC